MNGDFIKIHSLLKELDSLATDNVRKCDVVSMILNFPAVDAVEVVRCKKCRHFGGVIYGNTCRLHSYGNTRVCMGENDFCSHGEKKVDGDG